MPKPGEKENRDDFLARCMNFPEMKHKYPDGSQRYAVCVSIWDKHKKKKKANNETHKDT